ncbi:MAG: hypothetical protein V1882_07730 [Candidatus Omnitrophota bacterium]
MRKPLSLAIFSFLITAALTFGVAEKCSAESNPLAVLAPQKGNSKKDEAARAAFRKLILEKKAELNGSSWTVKIESQSKKGDLVGEDTLLFQNDKFRSERADKIGYNSTNYTLTVQEQGPTIWETMQTSKKGEVCFWRGEWKDKVMTGIISRQLEKGSEEYYFTSSERKDIPKTTEEKPEETQINPLQETTPKEVVPVLGGAPVVAQKNVAVKATTTKATTKKKGWF